MLNRRALLTGLIAAPFVVKASSLMPVKAIKPINFWRTAVNLPGDSEILDLLAKRVAEAERLMVEQMNKSLYADPPEGVPLFSELAYMGSDD